MATDSGPRQPCDICDLGPRIGPLTSDLHSARPALVPFLRSVNPCDHIVVKLWQPCDDLPYLDYSEYVFSDCCRLASW